MEGIEYIYHISFSHLSCEVGNSISGLEIEVQRLREVACAAQVMQLVVNSKVKMLTKPCQIQNSCGKSVQGTDCLATLDLTDCLSSLMFNMEIDY